MKKNIKLISDFNLEIFYNFLSKKINQKIYKLHKPNFGLFHEKCFELIKNKKKNHIIFIWSKIEGVLKNFNSLLMNKKTSLNDLYSEVDEYISILKQLSKKSDYLIITSWTLPRNERGLYLKDFNDDLGLTKNINIINTRIANQMKLEKNFIFLNLDFLMKEDHSSFNPKLWYAAKIPYSQKAFEIATIEFSKNVNFAINKLGEEGQPVPQGFEFHSNKNKNFLSIKEILECNNLTNIE